MIKNIGILALQGGYVAHHQKLLSLGYQSSFIRNKSQLKGVDALIMPGGESTTMTYLLKKHDMWDDLKLKVSRIPVLATCAGVVLLQRMSVLDIDIVRNGYGRQLSSGIFPLEINDCGVISNTNGFFIRAPIINNINDNDLKILSTYDDNPVLVQKRNIIAATFHPELSDDSLIHKYFLSNLILSNVNNF